MEDTLECGEAKAGPHTEGQARPLQCRGPESTSGTSHDGKEGEKAVCVCVCVCVCALSRIRLFATPWTVVQQAPLSMGWILQARKLEWGAMPSSRGSS